MPVGSDFSTVQKCSGSADTVSEQHAGQDISELVPECPPVWVTAVLYCGPFAASMRLLLQNGSVMEIGSKGRIYGELLRLLNVLGMLSP